VPTFSPTTTDNLVDLIVHRVRTISGRAVVAIDGADAARPLDFAERVAVAIRTDGRGVGVVDLHDFVRPASVRLEYGRTDEESYRTGWFDYAALRREVIDGLRVSGRWLPRLWDERTDRSPRAARRSAGPDDVVLVAGPMLLGRDLKFDLTVRLEMSEPALRRGTPSDELWTVPALLAQQREADAPDILVRWDHPERPAVRS
jgi:hypothetical protein